MEPTTVFIRRHATNLLQNYIELHTGIPVRVHLSDHYFMKRPIMDKDLGKPKLIDTLVFWVDRLEGEEETKTFSITSKKLAETFRPFLDNFDYRNYEFIITQTGDGFYKDWNVQPIRIAEGPGSPGPTA